MPVKATVPKGMLVLIAVAALAALSLLVLTIQQAPDAAKTDGQPGAGAQGLQAQQASEQAEGAGRISYRNSALYALLVAEGITDAVVDGSGPRVLVEYDVPDGLDTTASQYYVFGAAASVFPNSLTIVLKAHSGSKVSEVAADTADILELANNSTTEEQFLAKLRWNG